MIICLVPGGYVSLTNANTYLIDATGTDPVLIPATAPSAAVVAAANAAAIAAAESSSYHPFKPSGGMYPTPSPYPGGVDEADRAALFHRSSHISGVVTSSQQSAAAAAAASGHCNHLNDGCECFRDYSMHRKVN